MAVQTLQHFDLWQEGYGGATVTVYIAGTTTKASLFTDQALTAAASNPQTLDSKTVSGITFGKFSSPLYTASSIYFDIDGEQTGIYAIPIFTLADVDISLAEVQPTGGSVLTDIAVIIARNIYVRDYGVFLPTSDGDASASTNQTTLTAAIGAAAGNSGGKVLIPSDTFLCTQSTVSAGVRLVGQGRSNCIIQSTTAGKIITLSGADAGLEGITIDGVSQVSGSIGVYSENINQTHLDDVLIKRFESGLHQKGGARAEWNDLFISTCVNGAKLHGDTNEFVHNEWNGGLIDLCTTVGIDLSYEDQKAWHTTLRNLGFENNTGTAIIFNGARHTILRDPWFVGNTANWIVRDDGAASSDNSVISLLFDGGEVDGGTALFQDTCQDVELDRMEISNVDFTLTSPDNNIVVTDCIEDSAVTFAGDGTKWTRRRRMQGNDPSAAAQTTSASILIAWAFEIAPGDRGIVTANVVANRVNGNEHAVYSICQGFHRPGSTLGYDAQSANYTVGLVVTGADSGATARIIEDSDSGATGTLTLRSISGTFENNELITDSSTGSATVNGTISDQNAVLLGSITNIITAVESDANWACIFTVSAGEVEVSVTGASAKTIDWVVSAKVDIA